MPKQTETNDEQRMAMAFRRRQVNRSNLPAARDSQRQPTSCGGLIVGLFELGAQCGDLFCKLPGGGLPMITTLGDVADGNAKFLHRVLLVSGTLFPVVPATTK